MAPPKPSQKRSIPQPPQYQRYPPRPPAGPPEVVDPIWLIKALAILIVAALICGYGTLCLLLYQGQWQLILHPKQTTSHPSEIVGTPIEFLRFGPDESATPQRTGWSVPAAHGARYAGITILLLPSGEGSLADALPNLQALHEAGVNLFAIDYRGYGQSAAVHPDEGRMVEDVDSAWQFLTVSRAVPGEQIVPYGIGLGTSLATHLAVAHPAIPAVILDSPATDPLTTIRSDPRTSLLPVKLLLRNRFALAEPLTTLKTPKLLLSQEPAPAAFAGASTPKLIVALPLARSSNVYEHALARFLDQYLTGTTQSLQPTAVSR